MTESSDASGAPDAANHVDATPDADYCGQCGRPAAETGAHGTCAARLELEPPRFCTHCARRMIVQVVPTGWTARCSVHGVTDSRAAAAAAA